MLGRLLLPIKPTRFRSLKTLIISLAVATLKGTQGTVSLIDSYKVQIPPLGLPVCLIG